MDTSWGCARAPLTHGGYGQPQVFVGWESSVLTFGEAARQWGVAKGTISKAIKTGKPSATRREDGSWSIDKAELARYLDAPLENGRR